MKDGYVQSLDDLIELKHRRKTVEMPFTGKPIPAAVIVNMTGLTINGLLNRGLKVHATPA